MAQIATRVSEEEKEAFERFCRDHDIKISQLIRWSIKEYIDKTVDSEEKESSS